MALTLRTITNAGDPLVTPDGTPLSGVSVTFELVNKFGRPCDAWDAITGERVASAPIVVTTDDAGEFTVDLWPTSRATEPVYYHCTLDRANVTTFKAPVTEEAGNLSWATLKASGAVPVPAEASELALHIQNTAIHTPAGSSHEHTNKDILDGLTDVAGELQYNGAPLGGDFEPADANIQSHITDASFHLSAAQKTDLTDGGDSSAHYHSADRNVDNHVSGTANKVYTAAEQSKLAGIEAGANNYTHPANHAATVITEDATHRFVTDTEKTAWDGKAEGNHTHDLAYAAKVSEHSHSNKATLDTYTQTEANLADAVTKKHAHTNAASLDKIGENAGNPTWNGSAWPGGASSNSFTTIAVATQPDVVADSSTDTLTLVAGTGITITTNDTTDTVTITATGDATPGVHASSHITGGSDVIANAVAGGNAGLMSGADKSKLDGLSNYTHPTGDGNQHVPATSTTNNGKVLKAGATAGSEAWAFVDYSELLNKPTLGDAAVKNTGTGAGTVAAGDHTHNYEPANANIQSHVTDTTYHLNSTQKTDLTDGGDSTLHYHAADRNTDNHVSGTTNKVFTAAEQSKLAGIAAGAEVNVNADWNAGSGDAQILNKPTLGTAAAMNVPAAGDAASGEVVKGSDSRLSDARTPTAHNHDASYAPLAKGVTNGDSHDHNGGDGAQIDHANLSNKGTNTHAQIDSHLASTSNPHGVTAAQAGAMATTHAANLITGFGASGAATTVARSDHNHSGAYEAVDSNIMRKNAEQVMAAKLVAQNTTDYTVAQVRNVFLSTSAPTTEGGNGDIWIKYTA